MLEIDNLTITYDKQTILNKISITFEPGKLYGLIGINGCGKTSLLNAIAKFIDYTGEIRIESKSTRNYVRKELAKRLSYMRQNNNINFSYTVEEIVNMSQYSNNFSKKNKDYVDEIIDVCDLEELLDKNILNISGGQKQRVFFAKALAQDSDIILIDEGFSNIDIFYQIKFMEYLRKLSIEEQKTIIVVIHDINLALKTIEEVAVFNNANIYAYGKAKDVITKKMMIDVFSIDTEITHYGIDYKNIII